MDGEQFAFGEKCNLVRDRKMFVKDKAKVSSRVGGVKWRVVYFGKLFLSPMSKNSVLEELRVRRLAVIQEELFEGEKCWSQN